MWREWIELVISSPILYLTWIVNFAAETKSFWIYIAPRREIIKRFNYNPHKVVSKLVKKN